MCVCYSIFEQIMGFSFQSVIIYFLIKLIVDWVFTFWKNMEGVK